MYSMLPKRSDVLVEMEDFARQRNIPIVGPAMVAGIAATCLDDQCENGFRIGLGYRLFHHLVGAGCGRKRACYLHGRRRQEWRAGARLFRSRQRVSNQITLHTGDALEFLSEQKQQFDIIFNDVDKKKIIRACCVWYRRACARADYLLQIMFCGVGAWQRKIRSQRKPRRSLSSIAKIYSSADFVAQRSCRIRDGLAVA